MTRSTSKIDVDGKLRYKNQIRLAKGTTKGNVARVSPHDFDDGDTSVTLRGCPDSFDTAGGNKNSGRITRRHVVDHLLELELTGARNDGGFVHAILEAVRSFGVRLTHPLVGFVGEIEPKVVVDRLGGEDGGDAFAQRLQSIGAYRRRRCR